MRTFNVKNHGIPGNIKDHFNANIEYFNTLLNKDFTQKNVFLTSEDKTVIKEAYNKAHHVREYEISLFWSRLNYLWVINAVLFTAWGILVNQMLNAKEISGFQFISLFFLSSLGCAFTFLATSIAKAGKHWQQVWELHVHMLEPFVSGNLYKMQFEQSLPKPSISKSIMVFYNFSLIIWVLSSISAAVIPYLNSKLALLFELMAIIILITILYIIDRSIKKPTINNIKLSIKFKNSLK
ncbi:hypothetical protein [Pantoea dispersa]|uniref:RipA family octameric membrane protein n=1 Tax=Pantoea dispersa TaxID=59814 RepID=UPI0021C5D9E3|nr:hypothetical protein [Pantoea dispersa]UXO67326.1 hypothetical protein N7977_12665 [Pantoea dispersa]